jgi:hypothetical protein
MKIMGQSDHKTFKAHIISYSSRQRYLIRGHTIGDTKEGKQIHPLPARWNETRSKQGFFKERRQISCKRQKRRDKKGKKKRRGMS